ncbi:MAG: Queuosine Biosynthesis QueE Radical [Myxococcaceae bacterium]|nr:Queuosine Biosynthesis QueE Radical [Myxococcaceae bacterium]
MRDDVLLIHEIYASIQGESSFAGLPCSFVRTTGCNLRCSWCDTTQAFHGGQKLSRAEVFERVLALNTPLVELTGGEPLLQAGVLPLMRELCDAGKTVLIETSGERDISAVDPRVHRIVDIKAPGSGESEKNRYQNFAHLTERDELKLVLADRADYEWARELVVREQLQTRVKHVLFSPVHGVLDPQDLVAWTLADALPVRVNLQLHKYVWSATTQGV